MSLNFSSLELTDKTIIIVEDDVPSIRYYETLLQSSGADVIKFRTGRDFIDFVNTSDRKMISARTIDLDLLVKCSMDILPKTR